MARRNNPTPIEIVNHGVNADINKVNKQPDQVIFEQFVRDGKDDNCWVEYANHAIAYNRRNCLYSWLKNSGYANAYYLKMDGNKVYLIKNVKGEI